MATRYEPIQLQLIEEGRVLEDLNNLLQTVSGDLANYVQTWGEQAKRANAKVQLTIKLQKEDADDAFSIKSEIKATAPRRPAVTTLAIASENDNDETTLFVRASGSDSAPPQQRKIFTEDGRPIDVATGEVLEG